MTEGGHFFHVVFLIGHLWLLDDPDRLYTLVYSLYLCPFEGTTACIVKIYITTMVYAVFLVPSLEKLTTDDNLRAELP